MVDREGRDKVAAAVRAYMAEEIGASEFDDRIFRVYNGPTEDQTLMDVVRAYWGCYDDLKDHKIVASKQEWDYFNRLLLVLESDAEREEITVRRRWGPSNAVAACGLAVFVYGWAVTGLRQELLHWTVPLGIVSMLLAHFGRDTSLTADELARYPFPSVGALRSVYRSVPGFVRRRYPRNLERRRIRGPIGDSAMWLPAAVLWLTCSPVALLFQSWQGRKSEWTVRLPEVDPSAVRRS